MCPNVGDVFPYGFRLDTAATTSDIVDVGVANGADANDALVGAHITAFDVILDAASQFLREWKDREGRKSMLPWDVDDDSHDDLEYYEYSRARTATGIKLVANYKEKGIFATRYFCHLVNTNFIW